MRTMTMSVRMPEDLALQLDRLAEASRRSKSFCIVDYLFGGGYG